MQTFYSIHCFHNYNEFNYKNAMLFYEFVLYVSKRVNCNIIGNNICFPPTHTICKLQLFEPPVEKVIYSVVKNWYLKNSFFTKGKKGLDVKCMKVFVTFYCTTCCFRFINHCSSLVYIENDTISSRQSNISQFGYMSVYFDSIFLILSFHTSWFRCLLVERRLF